MPNEKLFQIYQDAKDDPGVSYSANTRLLAASILDSCDKQDQYVDDFVRAMPNTASAQEFAAAAKSAISKE